MQSEPCHPPTGQPESIAVSEVFELALSHHRAGRLAEAEQIYRRVVSAEPTHVQASLGLGLACSALDKHSEAIDAYRRALSVAPDLADAHLGIARSLTALQQIDEAIDHYRRVLKLRADSSVAVHELLALLERLGRYDEAISCCENAAAVWPNEPELLLRLGRMLRQTHRYAEASVYLERRVALVPDDVNAWFDLAYAYDAQRRFEAALTAYRKALVLQPDSAPLNNNLAFTLVGLARYEEAERHFREAIRLQPTLSEAHNQLGMLLLRRGHYSEGWRHFEHRKTTARGVRNYAPLPFPEWQGQPLQGKRFLLAREQGAGDQLQFIRYAAVLRDLGASVDVWLQEDLVDLCRSASGVNEALGQPPSAGYDYWCRLMSVPAVLPASTPIHTTVPYLFADRARASDWSARLQAIAGGTRKIGLVWAGNPAHHFDAFRSVPLRTLAPLGELPGISWCALQKGPAQNEIASASPDWPIHSLGDELHDFAASAALIDALDLVITVDTSIAHLAGALGKPVWILLAAQPDWRWMLHRADSVWYPTARLFRQETLGEWGDVVTRLKQALLEGLA